MTDERVTSEADLIAMLRPLATGAGAFGLRDDCATLTSRPGYDLVLKTDPVRAGVHFFAADPPEDIAWKALAVNVSDLAAKGAEPRAYLMAIAFPERPLVDWLRRFVAGLGAAQSAFGCTLIGGDTDRAPGPLSVAITAIGEVPAGRMVRRGTARPGDVIFVSGTLGCAGLGLQLHAEAREGRRQCREAWGLTDAETAELIGRYLRPRPRLALAPALRRHASAAMDVSDGLVKDLERMCAASATGASLEAGALPWSPGTARALGRHPELLASIIAAGDDYEILAAVPPGAASTFVADAARASVVVTRIGTIEASAGVTLSDASGVPVSFDRTGWDHF